TEHGRTSRHHHLCQVGATADARLAGAAVDQQHVLVLALLAEAVAVVVDAAAAEVHRRGQGGLDALVESPLSRRAQPRGDRGGPYARPKAGFVTIDVAEA